MEHNNSQSASYAAAGVDITAGYKAVELMKTHIARTRNLGVSGRRGRLRRLLRPAHCRDGGAGAGLRHRRRAAPRSNWPSSWTSTTPSASTAVAMCVNDIICVGAKPLFFLDYIACGKNVPEKIAEIVGGVAEGCVQSGCGAHRRRNRRAPRPDARGGLRSCGLRRGDCG